MEKELTIVIDGYQLHAGGQELPDGTYEPTLAIVFGKGPDLTRVHVAVTCERPYATIREAQEHAFEEGVRWVKEKS